MSYSTLDSLNMSMKIAHGVTQLLDDTTILGGDTGLDTIKVLVKLGKKLEEKPHKLLVQHLINCIKYETKGSYVAMSSLIPKVVPQDKVVPKRVDGDPPMVVAKPTYHQQGNGHTSPNQLWINFNTSVVGTSTACYPEVATFKNHTRGSSSEELNVQGWCDALPDHHAKQLKKSPGGLYFPLSILAQTRFKGEKKELDGLMMGLVQVRKNAKKKKGLQVIGFQ
jgi:hypothetical protein